MNVKPLVFLLLLVYMPVALADGSTIGKVYLPYVQPLEKELEYMALYEDENTDLGDARTLHQLALGASVSSRWYVEGIVRYVDKPASELESYEFEAQYQLTEQGEYDSDWGLLFELEKEDGYSAWEGAIGLLNTREWQSWQFTTNLFLIREWGGDVKSEFETALAFQAKYRHSRAFEPGLELFLGQDTRAAGPTIGGQMKVSAGDKLFWQLALLLGGSDKTADRTFKLELDYEFF